MLSLTTSLLLGESFLRVMLELQRSLVAQELRQHAWQTGQVPGKKYGLGFGLFFFQECSFFLKASVFLLYLDSSPFFAGFFFLSKPSLSSMFSFCPFPWFSALVAGCP